MERYKSIIPIVLAVILLAALFWIFQKSSTPSPTELTEELIEQYYVVPENSEPIKVDQETIKNFYTVPK